MEGAIKLNIGNKMDCPLTMGKSAEKGKGELKEKKFGDIMISLMPQRKENPKMKALLENDADEKLESGCLPDIPSILTIPKPTLEIHPEEIAVCRKKPSEEKADPIAPKTDDVSVKSMKAVKISDLKPAGIVKAQIVQSENENVGQEKGVLSSIFFRGMAGKIPDAVGKSVSAEREFTQKPDIKVDSEIRPLAPKLVGMEEIEMADKFIPIETQKSKAPNQDRIDKLIQPEPRILKTLNFGMAEKPERVLDYSESANPENRSLHSAKEQSILNRLTEIGTRIGGNEYDSRELKLESLQEEAAERISKPEEAGEKIESFAKAFGETMGIETGNSKMEIGKAEVPFGGRLVENLDEVADSIDLAMDRIQDNGKSVMRVRLKPDELGSIEIRLSQENGIVKGRIMVENESIKEQLSNFLLEDKLSFMHEGLRPREIEVSLFNQQTGAFENFDQGAFEFQRESGNGGFSEFFGEKGDSPKQQMEEKKAISGGLDMFA